MGRSRSPLYYYYYYSVGTYQETSSHATRQEKLSHSRLNSLSHRGLILILVYCARANSHQKKKKKCRPGNVCSNILPKTSQARKKPPNHHLKIQEELEHPVRNLGKAFREWQAGKADSELALSEQTNKQANKQTNKPGRLQNVMVFTDGPVLLKASFGGASL